MLKKDFFAAVAVLVLTGCGTYETGTESNSKAIVTNLTEQGASDTVYSFYVEGTNVVRAECREGMPAIRRFCYLNKQRMPYSTFKTALNNGLTDSVRELEAQVEFLNGRIATVEAGIRDTLALIAEREAQGQGLSADVLQARDDIAAFESALAGYREELDAIDEFLAQMDDVSLRRQREQMVTEMQEIQDSLEQITSGLGGMENRLSEISLQIAMLREEVAPAQAELVQLNRELAAATSELAILKNDLRNYDRTIMWLETSFSTRILADEDQQFPEERPFVRRFHAIFDR